MQKIGLISDTHGLLRPQALAALSGCDHIIHAGDIGDGAILAALRNIAPVTAVRGNNDTGMWAKDLPETETISVEKVSIYIIHDIKELSVPPKELGVDVIVAGHSHRPGCQQANGVILINPGSAGPRRFKLPVAVGFLIVDGQSVRPQLQELSLTEPASSASS